MVILFLPIYIILLKEIIKCLEVGDILSKKTKMIINYFLVELDLICPEIDVDDFSSISSMLNFYKIKKRIVFFIESNTFVEENQILEQNDAKSIDINLISKPDQEESIDSDLPIQENKLTLPEQQIIIPANSK